MLLPDDAYLLHRPFFFDQRTLHLRFAMHFPGFAPSTYRLPDAQA